MNIKTRTVADLTDGVAGLLTGTNLNNVTNLNNAFERALRTFMGKAPIPESSASQILSLYDGVYDYQALSGIFGGALKDIQPLGVSRDVSDVVYRQFISDFDRTKSILPNGYAVTFETINGVQMMRIAQVKATPRITIDPMSDTTGWTAAGSASVLTKDESFFYDSPASLRFTLTGNSSGTLTKTITNSVDLTSYLSVGVVFLALEIPSTSLSSVELRYGSSSSAYYSLSVTSGFLGAWTSGNFLITAFDLSQASTTGSPDITKMKYVRLNFTHSATMTNVRVGNLFIALPSPHMFLYESTTIFKASDGTISNYITNTSDQILLNDSAYNIYEHECAITVGLQMGGSVAGGLVGNLNSILNGARARNGQVITLGLYDLYRANNPSEEVRIVGNYYD